MTDEIQHDQPTGEADEREEERDGEMPETEATAEAENDDEESAAEAQDGKAADEATDGAEDEAADNVVRFPSNATDHAQVIRMTEALLFAAAEPLDIDSIAARLPEGADVGAAIEDLQKFYEERGVNLVRIANKWMFRTADDMAFLMEREAVSTRKLSRAAMETLAIIAYHQPVTRAEIEEIRGVSVSKGTLDVLMETEWVRLRGRRRTPGRPVTYGTTEEFLVHFGLENVGDLPGAEELKAAGLLDGRLPPGFEVPTPSDSGGDGDGDFTDDEPLNEEYGAAMDEHLTAGGEEE
ncbi:segregation and condensation protein B [Parvibaculum indicum]|nr:segregation and condensation protein B [Parvibaculum indicum]